MRSIDPQCLLRCNPRVGVCISTSCMRAISGRISGGVCVRWHGCEDDTVGMCLDLVKMAGRQ